MSDDNGYSEPRVSFDTQHGKTMPLEWASAFLTWLYDHDRAYFGYVLSTGVMGVEPANRRARSRTAA